MNLSTSRVLLILGIVAFTALFQWAYITWVHPSFAYMGFHYETPPLACLALSWVLAVTPGLWLAYRLTRPSQLIIWVLYLTVFIPSMFVPLYIALQPYGEIVVLMLTLAGGFCIASVGTALPPVKFRLLKVPAHVFTAGLWVVVIALLAWVITVFAGNFSFVAFHEVYEKIRFSGAEVASGTGVGYAVMWLAGAFNPFLMALGLAQRRPKYFAFGALGQVVLYCTGGQKSILLSALVLPALWVVLRGENARFALRIVWGTAALLLLTNGYNQIVGELDSGQLMFSAIILMRTFGVPGLVSGQYAAFFSDHPHTNFSHVTGINALVDSPYKGQIGKEVGYFFTGNLDYNANAHLWCMDGLAGFGLPGILLISVLCALAFWMLNSAAEGHNPVFAALAASFSAVNLSNVSLFTTLLSGGLVFTIALLYLKPVEARDDDALAELMPDDESAALDIVEPAGFSQR